jgi:hypothetical protein
MEVSLLLSPPTVLFLFCNIFFLLLSSGVRTRDRLAVSFGTQHQLPHSTPSPPPPLPGEDSFSLSHSFSLLFLIFFVDFHLYRSWKHKEMSPIDIIDAFMS